MSRKPGREEGSLELLLDTICNTFGGVLFISILVVILLNTSSREVAEATPSEAVQAQLVAWQERLVQTSQDLATLETAFREQESIEQQIVEPGLREMMGRLRESQQRRAEMAEQRNEDLTHISQAQRDANEVMRRWKEMQQRTEESRQKLDKVRRALEQEISARSRAAKLPKARETNKGEIVLFLRNGWLCSYARVDRNGNVVPNPDEVVEKRDEQQKPYIEPKPGAGIAVDPRGGNAAEIDERFAGFDSGQYYLAIFVWPDSFQHFNAVKERMVSKQFEYRLVPFPADTKIYLGASAAKAKVQ